MKVTVSILAIFLAAGSLLADEPRTAFPGSLAPIPAQAHDLTATRPVAADELVSFQIALRLQEGRTAPEADYQALVRWLKGQGLTVTESEPPLHSMVQAGGTVGQVGQALDVRFGRVEVGGRACVAALSAPSLPAALSGAVIGINGLQPFLRMNKHSVSKPPVVS